MRKKKQIPPSVKEVPSLDDELFASIFDQTIATLPSVPTVEAQAAYGLDTLPVLSGNAQSKAGDRMTVAINGAVYVVRPLLDGSWSLDLARAVPVSGELGAFEYGRYGVTVAVTDMSGNCCVDSTAAELIFLDPSASP